MIPRPQRLVVNAWAGSGTSPFAIRNVASAARKNGFEKVASYRLYCLDGVDKVASAEWVEAQDDEAAIAAAEGIRGARTCELWQGKRLVARLGSARAG